MDTIQQEIVQERQLGRIDNTCRETTHTKNLLLTTQKR